MGWNYGSLFVLATLILTGHSEQDRNIQSFVRIDVSKINQKIANESSSTVVPGNESAVDTTIAADGSSTTASATTSTTPAEVTTKGQNTTASPPSTTVTTSAKPKSTEAPVPESPFEPPKEGRITKKIPAGYYCSCDLKINICDVNCCCDIDCSHMMLKTFDCDQEQLDIGEYLHRDGLQSCEIQGGLFCLVGNHHDETDRAFYDPNLKGPSSKHKWKEIFPVTENPKEMTSSSYRVNDFLLLYNETSERVETFALPYSLTNAECQIKQPVRFLHDQSTECLRTLEDMEAFSATLLEQQSNVQYLRLPKPEIMEHCMDEDCFNSSVRFCNLFGRNCQKSNQTETPEPDGTWHCPQVRFEFLHNYTHLSGMHIRFWCGSAELTGLEMDSVWQKIVVEFKRKDEDKFSRKISGNLGYLQGRPLIVSTLRIPENDTAEEKRSKKYQLSYFTNETRAPDETFRLKLPKSRRNRCTLDEQVHFEVLFGENSWNKCNFCPQQNVTKESNFTEVCNSLQQGIFHFLLYGVVPQVQTNAYDSVNLYLSKYGNPVNRSSDWVQFQPLNVINEKVTGSPPQIKQETAAFFSCSNMLINVKYHFYHARTTVRNVPRQQVLREAEIVFGPRVDLQFPLDEDIKVPIFAQVQFFDLTSNGVRRSWLGIDPIWICMVSCIIVVSFKRYCM